MKNNNKIRIGVIGVGYHGKNHIETIKKIPYFELVGCFDISLAAQKAAENNLGVKFYSDPLTLLNNVDAIDIVTPAFTHDEYLLLAISQKKHIFVEKPPWVKHKTTNYIKDLLLNNKIQGVFHFGMIERYNPAYIQASKLFQDLTPYFIESIRRSPYPGRGTDVSVLLDVAIHDIDIFLLHWNSKVKSISGISYSIFSDDADTVDAFIEFESGITYHIYASRVSPSKERRCLIYAPDMILNVDFLSRSLIKYTSSYRTGIPEQIDLPDSFISPLHSELENFARDILNNHNNHQYVQQAIQLMEFLELLGKNLKNISIKAVAHC